MKKFNLRSIEKSCQGRSSSKSWARIIWLLVTAAPNGTVPKHSTCWITKWCSSTSKPEAVTSCCDSNFRLSSYWPVSCLRLTETSTILPFLCTVWGFNQEPGEDHPSASPATSGVSLETGVWKKQHGPQPMIWEADLAFHLLCHKESVS